MNYSLRALIVPAACLVLSACGDTAELASGQRRGDALTDSDMATLDGVAFGDLEADSDHGSGSCKTIRLQIWTRKQALRLSSEWANVSKSTEWEKLKGDHETFVKHGCTWTNSEPAGCADALKVLKADWKAVTEMPEWAVLIKQDGYKQLHADISKAIKMDCYKGPEDNK